MLHLSMAFSVWLLLVLFSTWYMAVMAILLLVVIAYPILAWAEQSRLFKRVAVERKSGEFRKSLIIAQASVASLIVIFWGLMGTEWRYVAVVAVMAWGFGDAAAALVGKTFGRHRIRHRQIEGSKTVEGTQAMYVMAGLAAFLTLLLYARQPWYMSLAVALLVAPVCAVVELFSHHGMDTLTVPLSAGFAVLFAVALFTVLGV
jgi:phytol kinase